MVMKINGHREIFFKIETGIHKIINVPFCSELLCLTLFPSIQSNKTNEVYYFKYISDFIDILLLELHFQYRAFNL